MDVFIEKEDIRKRLEFNGSVKALLKLLKINKETVIVVKNDELVNEEEMLRDADSVKILSVISGG